MNPDLLQRLVVFFLNTYSEVESPRAALLYVLEGDALLGDRLLAAWQALAKADARRWVALQMPEAGDCALREWLVGICVAN
jgi:hypothetical protein